MPLTQRGSINILSAIDRKVWAKKSSGYDNMHDYIVKVFKESSQVKDIFLNENLQLTPSISPVNL
jgi:hypothetical protein